MVRHRVKQSALQVTQAAAHKIKELLNERHKDYLQLGVQRTGCSGLAYTLKYVDERGPREELVEAHGVRILIEPNALMKVVGTRLDYHQDKLKSEFVFMNPNVVGMCGCGESFTVKGCAR